MPSASLEQGLANRRTQVPRIGVCGVTQINTRSLWVPKKAPTERASLVSLRFAVLDGPFFALVLPAPIPFAGHGQPAGHSGLPAQLIPHDRRPTPGQHVLGAFDACSPCTCCMWSLACCACCLKGPACSSGILPTS